MARTKKEKEILDTTQEDMLGIISQIGNDAAQTVDEGLYGDVEEYIDTGSYTFNAILSGTLFGGFPFSRITGFAGEEGTGKTFYVLDIVKQFFKQNPKGFVFYYESENSLDKNLFLSRGIDPKRVFVIPVNTVEEFKTQCLKATNGFMELEKSKRPKVLYILDSLGMLSTIKEQTDSLEGKHVRDMTRAQVLRGAFRTLTLNLGAAGIPMIVTNHTYQVVGCTTKETNVITSYGKIKPINEIGIGEYVRTQNGVQKVIDKYEYDSMELYEVEFEDRLIVRVTPNHKFLLETGEWKRIDELKEFDKVVTLVE